MSINPTVLHPSIGIVRSDGIGCASKDPQPVDGVDKRFGYRQNLYNLQHNRLVLVEYVVVFDEEVHPRG
jgi:hypothetical protein